MPSFRGTLTLYGKIEAVTGLHIGGSGAAYEIGGVDNPVIRDVQGYPYIPGSSLKGKLRSLLEWATGRVRPDGKIHACAEPDCPVCRLFGSSATEERAAGPTRVLVRDAVPDPETQAFMDHLEADHGLPRVEVKTENNINRITSETLSGVRHQERVHPGAKFDFEIVLSAYEVEGCQTDDADMLKHLVEAMRILEDSALGGGGSRGSGQIAFHVGKTPLIRSAVMYRDGPLPSRAKEDLVPLAQLDLAGTIVRVRTELKGAPA